MKFTCTVVSPNFNTAVITKAWVAIPHTTQFYPVRALWDTGATSSCIGKNVAETLKLQAIGFKDLIHALGKNKVNEYGINIKLPNGFILPNIPVIECATDPSSEIIIGMDIISMGDFSLSGSGSQRMMSFCLPSTFQVDYQKIVTQLNQGL